MLASASVEIRGLAQVTSTIYRGGRPTSEGLAYLRTEFGVKTDINLQGGDVLSSDPATAAFMAWWEPGETPENIANEKYQAEEILKMTFGLRAIEFNRRSDARRRRQDRSGACAMNDPAMQPVYVHCEHGVDRTGLLIALYRVKYQGFEIEQAHDGVGRPWAIAGSRPISPEI